MEDTKPRVGVFASGAGSNLQALIDATIDGTLAAEIALVVSSKRKAYCTERAAAQGIETMVFKIKKHPSPEEAGDYLLTKLKEHRIDYIALAGYLSLLPAGVVQVFRDRIVNIHPALLPKYGGKGMYGRHVHEVVLASGDRESGPTVHLVDEIYDNGKVLEQAKIPVRSDDTPDTLAARVIEQEHKLYPRVIQKLINGEYALD